MFGCKIIYIPPYSPHLNPIEQFFNILKMELKRYRLWVHLYPLETMIMIMEKWRNYNALGSIKQSGYLRCCKYNWYGLDLDEYIICLCLWVNKIFFLILFGFAVLWLDIFYFCVCDWMISWWIINVFMNGHIDNLFCLCLNIFIMDCISIASVRYTL